jgi:hypothetical protein
LSAHQSAINQSQTGELHCQWCSVRLPAGETRCPTCGSPGIPDPNLVAPGIEVLEAPEVATEVTPASDLHEWWLDDDAVEDQARRATLTPSAVEDKALRTVIVLVCTGAVFTFLGWLVGPLFLSPAMESITGTPVERASDLRPMGGLIGLFVGLFIGAGYGWIAGSQR